MLKVCSIHRASDKMHKINLNRHYLRYFFNKSYVGPLVRIISMRRFLQLVKHMIWWRNRHYRNENTHLIWSSAYISGGVSVIMFLCLISLQVFIVEEIKIKAENLSSKSWGNWKCSEELIKLKPGNLNVLKHTVWVTQT